jgi:hypothetical protein
VPIAACHWQVSTPMRSHSSATPKWLHGALTQFSESGCRTQWRELLHLVTLALKFAHGTVRHCCVNASKLHRQLPRHCVRSSTSSHAICTHARLGGDQMHSGKAPQMASSVMAKQASPAGGSAEGVLVTVISSDRGAVAPPYGSDMVTVVFDAADDETDREDRSSQTLRARKAGRECIEDSVPFHNLPYSASQSAEVTANGTEKLRVCGEGRGENNNQTTTGTTIQCSRAGSEETRLTQRTSTWFWPCGRL